MAVEDQYASVHQWLTFQITGVVYQVSGGEVVRSVNHQIVLADDLSGVVGFQSNFVENDVGVWIVGNDIVPGRIQLGASDVAGVMKDLPLQVGDFNHVEINDPDGAHARQSQIYGRWGAQTASANNQRFCPQKVALALAPHIAHDDMPAVPIDLIRCQDHWLLGHFAFS